MIIFMGFKIEYCWIYEFPPPSIQKMAIYWVLKLDSILNKTTKIGTRRILIKSITVLEINKPLANIVVWDVYYFHHVYPFVHCGFCIKIVTYNNTLHACCP